MDENIGIGRVYGKKGLAYYDIFLYFTGLKSGLRMWLTLLIIYAIDSFI
jgi:hypothetical protein